MRAEHVIKNVKDVNAKCAFSVEEMTEAWRLFGDARHFPNYKIIHSFDAESANFRDSWCDKGGTLGPKEHEAVFVLCISYNKDILLYSHIEYYHNKKNKIVGDLHTCVWNVPNERFNRGNFSDNEAMGEFNKRLGEFDNLQEAIVDLMKSSEYLPYEIQKTIPGLKNILHNPNGPFEEEVKKADPEFFFEQIEEGTAFDYYESGFEASCVLVLNDNELLVTLLCGSMTELVNTPLEKGNYSVIQLHYESDFDSEIDKNYITYSKAGISRDCQELKDLNDVFKRMQSFTKMEELENLIEELGLIPW